MTKADNKPLLTILHLEDNVVDRELVLRTLKSDGVECEVVHAKKESDFQAALSQLKFDLIISDFTLPSYDGMSALHAAQRLQPQTPFLFLSGTIGEERAVESLRAGATDYVLKDNLGRLAPAIRRALREARERNERRQLEEQLRQAQKMEAIGQLAGGVAHDFNNILCVIQGHTELLLTIEQNLASESKEWLREIVSASGRAASLTRQLLAFGRKQVMQSRPMQLNDVITDLMKMLGRIIGANVRLNFTAAGNLPLVNADPGMMEQVLMNLVINARDAMPKGGELRIATELDHFDTGNLSSHPEARTGEFVCLRVLDTGTGIAPEHLARIFEPFFTTKAAGKGTGLGLATVYGIVKQHGGWIEVATEAGKGTQFEVFLPAIPLASHTKTPRIASEKVAGGTECILLVEDDVQVRHVAARALKNVGYTICEAASGEEALQIWEKRSSEIALLLTDMVMPDNMNGRELAEKLRSRKPTLKVLYSSGYSTEVAGANTDFFQRNKTRFLQKPYSLVALRQMVRQCLDEVAT